MRRLCRPVMAIAIVGLGTAAAAQTQETQEAVAIEPEAMDALQSMGTYLRTLQSFQVKVVTTDEDVLDDGQKLHYGGVVTVLAHMPDRVRAEVANDRYERMYLYDGESFTLFAKRIGLYATVPTEASTIGELARNLDEEYGYSVPLVDLFRWGGPGWSTDAITGAMVVGSSVIAGTTCMQYAYRQDDIDWQIWIQRGDHPLPRRLVITTKTDEARPQHTATYDWNLAPSFNEAAFVFDPPADAVRVVLDDMGGVEDSSD